MHRLEWGPWLLAAAALLILVLGIRPAARSDVDALDCTHAVVVGGLLRCGEEALVVRDACGHEHRLRSGDVLDPGSCEGPARMLPEELAALEVRIDVNADSIADLTSLPRVGPVLAERIVDGRPYESVDALLDVKGIGPHTLAGIRPRVLPPSTPRSPRASSATPP